VLILLAGFAATSHAQVLYGSLTSNL